MASFLPTSDNRIIDALFLVHNIVNYDYVARMIKKVSHLQTN